MLGNPHVRSVVYSGNCNHQHLCLFYWHLLMIQGLCSTISTSETNALSTSSVETWADRQPLQCPRVQAEPDGQHTAQCMFRVCKCTVKYSLKTSG